MEIAVISDLHGNLPEYDFKGVELLLICGDISPLQIQQDSMQMLRWLDESFTPWLNKLSVEKVIFIGGNHDYIFERQSDLIHRMYPISNKITYLENEYMDYVSNDGKVYKIFGTPYCKIFGNWPFMREDSILFEKYNEMPNDVDILLSHDAPKLNELGCIKQEGSEWYGEEAGNPVLAEVILTKKPKYCFCGHIHSGQKGLQTIEGIKLANASILDDFYKIAYNPLIFNV